MLSTNLSTERLCLRELRLEDAEEIFRLRSNRDVNALIDRPNAETINDAVEFIEKSKAWTANRETVMWAVTMIGETKLIGTIVYWHIEWNKNKAEIGYELLPEYWGKGIMTEALEKAISFGFKQLKFKEIIADPKAINLPSVHLLEKLGFSLTGKDGAYLMYSFRRSE